MKQIKTKNCRTKMAVGLSHWLCVFFKRISLKKEPMVSGTINYKKFIDKVIKN